MNEIVLTPGEEQTVVIGGFSFRFKFNPFDREWLFDMVDNNGATVLNNVVIRPDSYPMKSIDVKWDWPKVCLIDKEPDSTAVLNPLLDFGGRLGLYEITGD